MVRKEYSSEKSIRLIIHSAKVPGRSIFTYNVINIVYAEYTMVTLYYAYVIEASRA